MKLKCKKIKGEHVIVVAPGYNFLRYKDKISKFIEENNFVIFGCQNIIEMIIPDYHFWSDHTRWEEFGHLINEKSTFVFSKIFPENKIREHWKGKYLTFEKGEIKDKHNKTNHWLVAKPFRLNSKEAKRCRIYHKGETMFGCIRDIGTLAVFWAFIKGARKVTMIGFDGYTFYLKKDLDDEKVSQHFYGLGHTDGFIYNWERKQDWDRYRTFRLLHKYCKKTFGFSFEIITPTVYDKFYNSSVLNIETDDNFTKWKEPTKDEYEKLKIKNLKEKNKLINYKKRNK